jgi:hypothetical protein
MNLAFQDFCSLLVHVRAVSVARTSLSKSTPAINLAAQTKANRRFYSHPALGGLLKIACKLPNLLIL